MKKQNNKSQINNYRPEQELLDKVSKWCIFNNIKVYNYGCRGQKNYMDYEASMVVNKKSIIYVQRQRLHLKQMEVYTQINLILYMKFLMRNL